MHAALLKEFGAGLRLGVGVSMAVHTFEARQ